MLNPNLIAGMMLLVANMCRADGDDVSVAALRVSDRAQLIKGT